MKWSRIKAIIAAIISIASFLASAAVAIHMFVLKYDLHGSVRVYNHQKILQAMRLDQTTTYQDVPTMLFLACIGIVCGVLAIRFHNHAKSEFSS